MPEYLLVKLPDGKEWEMTAHLAKQLYDFIEQGEDKSKNIKELDLEKEWLCKLLPEDQKQVRKSV